MASHFLHLATEIIVVDSSSDETPEICRSMLPTRAEIIKHPPGLYQSWNAAIQTVESEFVYISTIGDTLDPGFMERMLDCCINNSLDMLISPPQFMGAEEGYFWPIHKIISKYNIRDLVVLEGHDAGALNLFSLSKYYLSSLSGSFASNLVRADLLKKNPFPTNYGGFGDTMWFARVCDKIRLGILPELGSTFLIHPKAHQKFSREKLDFSWLEALNFQSSTPSWPKMNAVKNKTEKHHYCKIDLKKIRKESSKVTDHFFDKVYLSLRKKYLYIQLKREIQSLEAGVKKVISSASRSIKD